MNFWIVLPIVFSLLSIAFSVMESSAREIYWLKRAAFAAEKCACK
jgi:hypothetical protein